jgi:hypothetical protein
MMSDRYLQSLADDYMEDEGDRADKWDEVYHELLESCISGEEVYNFDPKTGDFCGEVLYPHQQFILHCLALGKDKELLDLLNKVFDKHIEESTEYIFYNYL